MRDRDTLRARRLAHEAARVANDEVVAANCRLAASSLGHAPQIHSDEIRATILEDCAHHLAEAIATGSPAVRSRARDAQQLLVVVQDPRAPSPSDFDREVRP